MHRYEPSGALHGLLRVRAFTQDDAHVFCTEEQMADECLKINDLILSTYADFGFERDRGEAFDPAGEARRHRRDVGPGRGDHDDGARARSQQRSGGRIKTGINPGEGAFYGPKFEYVLRDAIGRDWQCGTTQVDFNLPERFEAFYIAADGSKKTPVMIHRAICGSMERFLGVLLEHYAGHLPLWLAPMQAVVATITSDADDYAREAIAAAQRLGLRAEADLRNEKINYKVREHSLAKVPVLLVVGKKEAAERTVSIRRLGKEDQQVMPLDAALECSPTRRCRRTSSASATPDARAVQARRQSGARHRRGLRAWPRNGARIARLPAPHVICADRDRAWVDGDRRARRAVAAARRRAFVFDVANQDEVAAFRPRGPQSSHPASLHVLINNAGVAPFPERAARDRYRRLAARARCQSHGRVPRHPGLPAADAESRRRLDHQHRLPDRHGRLLSGFRGVGRGLCGDQGRADRHHPAIGRRIRQGQNPRERHRARLAGAARGSPRISKADWSANMNERFEEAILDGTPMGRRGMPKELRGLVIYLASDASSYVTGQVIGHDGGWMVT